MRGLSFHRAFFLHLCLTLEGNWCLCSLWAFAVARWSSPSALGHSPEHAFILFGASVGLLCVAVAAGPDRGHRLHACSFPWGPCAHSPGLGSTLSATPDSAFQEFPSILSTPHPQRGAISLFTLISFWELKFNLILLSLAGKTSIWSVLSQPPGLSAGPLSPDSQ